MCAPPRSEGLVVPFPLLRILYLHRPTAQLDLTFASFQVRNRMRMTQRGSRSRSSAFVDRHIMPRSSWS